MRTVITIIVGLVVMLGLVLFGAARYVSAPLFEEELDGIPEAAFDVLPVDEALTLARTRGGRVLLVTAADETGITAVDLADALQTPVGGALEVYRTSGYESLASVAQHSAERVAMAELGMPFDPGFPHVAAGTNFRAHAEEVGLDEGPFLFPKLASATPWNAEVPARTRLDYEAELCAVTLAAYTPDAPAELGFVACNDFTDRWKLLEDIDLDTPMGQTGFPDAKGGSGMLPIGPFLVIPKDAAAFHRNVTLGLYVNGRLRQRDSAGLMIWTPEEIAQNALSGCNETYLSKDTRVSLTPCDAIPEATLLLTGTPAGVMFHYLNIWRAASYLRPGDEVITYGAHLGVLRNKVR